MRNVRAKHTQVVQPLLPVAITAAATDITVGTAAAVAVVVVARLLYTNQIFCELKHVCVYHVRRTALRNGTQ